MNSSLCSPSRLRRNGEREAASFLAEVFSREVDDCPQGWNSPLQFGMSEDEVLELLGKPDEVITRVPQVPITDEVSDIDGVKRPPWS